MAFGAEYAQTARGDNFLFFRVRFLFIARVKLGVSCARDLLFFGKFSVCVRDCHFHHFVVVALFAHTLFGEIFGVAAEQDIRSAARHIGCYGDGVEPARLRYYFGFALVVFGVEYVVFNAVSSQQTGNFFRTLYRYRTDKYGLTGCMAFHNFVYDSALFAFHGRVYHIRQIHALYGAVGGDGNYVERVNGSELVFFRHCRTRHTRELFVKAEIVLEGYGCVSLVLVLDLYLFLGFDCLMKSVRISSAVEHTARKFVYY